MIKKKSAPLFPAEKLSVRIAMIILGSFIYALAMNLFIDQSGLLPGGIAGLAKLLQRICRVYWGLELPYTLLNVGLNLIPAILALIYIGKRFVWLSFFALAISSVLIDLLPTVHITDDIFLQTVFAGVLQGTSMVLILNAKASSGGTDFIAMILSVKRQVSAWNYVFVYNAVLYTVSGLIFGVDKALYSIIYEFISTIIINMENRRFLRKTAFIITSAENAEIISKKIMELTGHGVTKFDGIGCYSSEKRCLLYTVLSKSDISVVRRYLRDEQKGNIFLNVTASEQLEGYFKIGPFD